MVYIASTGFAIPRHVPWLDKRVEASGTSVIVMLFSFIPCCEYALAVWEYLDGSSCIVTEHR